MSWTFFASSAVFSSSRPRPIALMRDGIVGNSGYFSGRPTSLMERARMEVEVDGQLAGHEALRLQLRAQTALR